MSCRFCGFTPRTKSKKEWNRHLWRHVADGDCVAVIWPGTKAPASAIPSFIGLDALPMLTAEKIADESKRQQFIDECRSEARMRLVALNRAKQELETLASVPSYEESTKSG